MPTKDIAKLTEIYFYLFWEVSWKAYTYVMDSLKTSEVEVQMQVQMQWKVNLLTRVSSSHCSLDVPRRSFSVGTEFHHFEPFLSPLSHRPVNT